MERRYVIKKKGSKAPLIISICAISVVVILAVVVVVTMVMRRGAGSAEPETADNAATGTSETARRSVIVAEDNVEETIALMQQEQEEYVAPGYYTVTQNYEWHFPSGTAESTDAHVENAPENTNDVYFDVYLADDEGHLIYSSPVITRGASIEKFALDSPLDAGTYDCVVTYHLVDEDQNTISTVSMSVTVVVEQ